MESTSMPLKHSCSSQYMSDTCVVCLDLAADVELKPCTHAVLCRRCICRLDDGKCPICRTKVDKIRLRGFTDIYSFHGIVERWNQETVENSESNRSVDAIQKDSTDSKVKFTAHYEANELKDNQQQLPQDSYVFSLDAVLQKRRQHEEYIRKHTYQVVFTGCKDVDYLSFMTCLQQLFPLKTQPFWQHDEWECSSPLLEKCSTSHNFTETKEALNTAETQTLEKLVDTYSSMEAYLPNAEIEGFPVHFEILSIWELLSKLRIQPETCPDLIVLCCNALSQKSFDELLSLDVLLRTRYAPGKSRMWLVLNYDEVQIEHSRDGIPMHIIEREFARIPLKEKASDLFFIRGNNVLFKFWHKEVAYHILREARKVRRLSIAEENISRERQRFCSCM